VNEEKLERLRVLYNDADGAEYLTERFKHVGEKLADRPHNATKPFSGIPTFLDMPYNDNFIGLDVALVGVPMDLGVTNRSGARFGPRAVRTIERVGPYSHVLDEVPRGVLKAADIGDVPMRSRFSLRESLDDIESFYKQIVGAGVVPLSVGGDHSISYPILKALGEKEAVGMFHIDAHMDTGGAYEGEKFHHGGPFRQAVLAGVLDPDRCVQIGIRGSAEFSGEFSYEAGMTVIHAEDVERQGIDAVVATAKKVLGDKPFYITIDVDGIDPAYTPGTGTPEVGGLSPLQVQMMLRELKGLNIIGGDVVEVAPQYDPTTNTAHVAAQLLFELFALLAVNNVKD
jgi:guanidinopropionase